MYFDMEQSEAISQSVDIQHAKERGRMASGASRNKLTNVVSPPPADPINSRRKAHHFLTGCSGALSASLIL